MRGRVNAWFFTFMDWYLHWKYARLKERLFSGLPSTVVEIGSGVGANFRYLPRGTRVVAFEPNVHMHAQLARTAQRFDVEVEIHDRGAESLDLPDESVDAVICSLVLCTVADPMQSLAEIRRVLRPGGRFICIEHVAASRTSFIGRIQRLVLRPWRWFFEGCHTHRETWRTLEQAGFQDLTIERHVMPTLFLPIRPQIVATAVK